ncbi:glycosyltransferase family 2 protein [Paractinoplanes deccanensis]|uniref:glycosyltransferase family 2 protein n=1 Tax=Paractinoplanes deccanensis TaxID=113561 RepID=UPI001942AD91|nr:glycosyltransferase family 2 protein [Actinoplanes deccanensis]
MTESSPGLRRATDRQILLPRSAKAGPLALPPAVPQLSDLENVEVVSGEIAVAATATPRNATISCIIPCYNEQETIADVLKSLLSQTRLPDVIHVIINNTDDDTPEIARGFEGRHTRTVKGEEFVTHVHVHDMGANPDKKVGALNYGYFLSRGFDYILGVDGDTTLARDAVERLELEMTDDPRIGGLSAIYSIDKSRYKGLMARFLIAGQRAQFAAFNMDNLLRGRNMAVLGGQCSLFSIRALETVMVRHHQQAPWVRDSEVEDSKLSLQIKDAGYSTKISATARAYVGPMTNLRALHGQQVKWNFGAIDLFWPGTRGDNQGQPLHPNLRLRWYENISMLFNIASRLGFLLLLVAALSIHAFVFNPIWLIPPAVAALLNLRLALAMKDKSASDILYAALVLPAELYMWIRMGHFVSAWTQFLAKTDKDNWAAQANAEKGKGSAYVMPLVVLLAILGGAIYAWSQQSVGVQSAILSLGWPILYIATIAQTVFMLRKLFRRHRAFTV